MRKNPLLGNAHMKLVGDVLKSDTHIDGSDAPLFFVAHHLWIGDLSSEHNQGQHKREKKKLGKLT